MIYQQYQKICQYQSQIQIITNMDINEVIFLGTNKYGQAGIGEKHHNVCFKEVKSYAFSTFVKQISCGAHHSALLTIDGFVYTMGSNIHGALGVDHNVNYSFVPNLVEGLVEVSRIQCGPFHMCAVEKGRLYSWGKGIDGQLGHGNTKNASRPTLIDSLTGQVESISCGTNHTLVSVRKEGKNICYAFGNGIYGQLGTGQSRNSYVPVKVKLQNIEQFAAGQNHSLFVIDGDIYACGDNSSGQLGTLFNKKFTSEPTRIQFQEESGAFVIVQAKKYSVGVTERGEMYVWGLRGGFGCPKQVRSRTEGKMEIVDVCISSDKCYCLTSEGALIEWDVLKGHENDGKWICSTQRVVESSRPILGFSAGDGYLMALGDIVRQIENKETIPHNLSYLEDVDSWTSNLKSEESVTNEAHSHFIADSHIVPSQDSREFNFDKIRPQSHAPLKESKNNNQSTERSSYLQKQRFEEQFQNSLMEKRDFSNLMHLKQEEPREEIQKHLPSEPDKSAGVDERDYNSHETLEFIKSQSSVIQCEPSNFLRDSERRDAKRNHTQNIRDSLLESEEFGPEIFAKNKRRAQEKENTENGNSERRGGRKKIDRLMEMLEKSRLISEKTATESVLREEECGARPREDEAIRANKLLRIEVRDKELKISQLQELLSRKEMEIEAQREVIKLLREKNSSHFASLDQP